MMSEAGDFLTAVWERYVENSKIKTRKELRTIVAQHQECGRKVVFTNGCFDLIHIGHIRYLREARQQGDVLIVAINSDASVRKIKGPQRPILGETERSRILEAFEVVDYITVFEEVDPWQIINDLKPDVLVKGGDYEINEIVGHDLVLETGGRVLSVPLVPGASTSKVIQTILDRYETA
jgi:rfaE bifunctional protein nucleotidyltransferase chain/domain